MYTIHVASYMARQGYVLSPGQHHLTRKPVNWLPSPVPALRCELDRRCQRGKASHQAKGVMRHIR